jgi:hypothetical protein
MACAGCDKDVPAKLLPIVNRYATADQRRVICFSCSQCDGENCGVTGETIKEQTLRLSIPCPSGRYAAAYGTCSNCNRPKQYMTDYGDCQWCEIERENKRRNQASQRGRKRVAKSVKRPSVVSNGEVGLLSQRIESTWTVAVTTAPRKDSTVHRCLGSICENGWIPTIFAEPGFGLKTYFQLFQHRHRLGVWHNWLASARWAIEQGSDFILTAQDDSLFHPESRLLIESIQWPADAAFVSLYTPKHYTVGKGGEYRPVGVRRVNTSSLWGACALVWRPGVLARFVDHPIAKTWLGVRGSTRAVMDKRKADPALIANSDTAIGNIANALGLTMYFVDPSPVEHVAKYSTIGHGGNSGRRNAYRIADRSEPLVKQVLGK